MFFCMGWYVYYGIQLKREMKKNGYYGAEWRLSLLHQMLSLNDYPGFLRENGISKTVYYKFRWYSIAIGVVWAVVLLVAYSLYKKYG